MPTFCAFGSLMLKSRIKTAYNLSKPEDALIAWVVWILQLDFDVKALINHYRNGRVLGITWNRMVSHLHHLDLLQLSSFLGIFRGPDRAGAAGWCICRRKMFGKQLLCGFIFLWRNYLWCRARVCVCIAMAGSIMSFVSG